MSPLQRLLPTVGLFDLSPAAAEDREERGSTGEGGGEGIGQVLLDCTSALRPSAQRGLGYTTSICRLESGKEDFPLLIHA